MAAHEAVIDRPPWRGWVAPGLAFVILMALLITVVVVATLTGDAPLPPRPAAFVTPQPATPALAFDVERVNAGTLTLAGGQDAARERFELSVPPTTRVDVLEKVAGSAMKPGDWITVVGIKNEARNFAVRLIVVIPGPVTADSDGWARTAAGFLGSETAREVREVAILGGTVRSIAGSEVVLDQGGAVTIQLNQGAPVRRVRAGSLADIADGDRIAMHLGTDGKPQPGGSILLLSRPD